MKQDYTKFTCDKCKKETLESASHGFPFEKAWCQLINFTTQVLRLETPGIETDVAGFEVLNKHFCSEKCMIDFIKLTIKENKKIKKEKIDLKECVEIYKKTEEENKNGI